MGFTATSIVYVALEKIFPPTETFIERAILPDEIYDAQGYSGDDEAIEEIDPEHGEAVEFEGEKRGYKYWAEKIL